MTPLRTLRRRPAATTTIRLAIAALLAIAVGLAGAILPGLPGLDLGPGPGGAPTPAYAHNITVVPSITSSPGADGEYIAGETITVRVTFSSCVHSATASPALTITLGSGAVSATTSATLTAINSATIDFSYAVQATDYDYDGISVATGALAGEYRVYADTNPATCSGNSHTSGHTSITLSNALAAAQYAHPVYRRNGTNHDTDGDRLIEVSTPAQLNAIRHNLNGNGLGTHADYLSAFSNSIGCPGRCRGYELAGDIDFAGTAYVNGAGFVPLGTWSAPFTATFHGRGYTISNLTINSSNVDQVGLFGRAHRATIESVGLLNVNITPAHTAAPMQVGALVGMSDASSIRYSYSTGTVTATGSGGGSGVFIWAGGLVGEARNGGRVSASWSSATVTVTSDSTHANQTVVGGLIGRAGVIGTATVGLSASYATGNASATRNVTQRGCRVGGLVGQTDRVNLRASYAAGRPSCSPHALASAHAKRQGGLLGYITPNSTITNSYYDSSRAGATTSITNFYGAGKTTAQLQNPTSYAGDFADWNINNTDPWHFGTSSQYPAIAAGHDRRGIYRQWGLSPPTFTAVDYDTDDNKLIEVSNLAQLDAIRYNLNGDGYITGNILLGSAAPYPNADRGMGCPDNWCQGYELTADLDFDTNGDGVVNSSDDYPSWVTFGHYYGIFDGNGHTISNLTISGTSPTVSEPEIYTGQSAGLFASVSTNARVENLGLVDVNIDISYPSNIRYGSYFAGALAGTVRGTVQNVYATGAVSLTITGTSQGNIYQIPAILGGLVGTACGAIAASWTDVDVTLNSASTRDLSDHVGGLAGNAIRCHTTTEDGAIIASYARGDVAVTGTHDRVSVGGIAGSASSQAASVITASYSTGAVTASPSGANVNVGGLVGQAPSGRTFTNAYWDTTTSMQTSSAGGSGVTGYATSALQTPTEYGSSTSTPPSIYAAWNLNVDGDTDTGAMTTGADDPWHFGSASQYPILKFGHDAYSINRQQGIGAAVVAHDYDANDNNLIDVGSLAQLNAVRWDLDGNGVSVTGDNALKYAAAYPNMMANRGCPDGCTGYELTAHLDFDENGDGAITETGDPTYWNAGAGWDPIGPYTGDFHGNGRTISNLFINASGLRLVGLFSELSGGEYGGIGLVNADVTSTYSTAGNWAATGALVGKIYNADLRNSYSTGSVTYNGSGNTRGVTGGLIGETDDQNDRRYVFAGLWSSAAVTINDAGTWWNTIAGGLIGLVHQGSDVVACYATGAVSSPSATRGAYLSGLIGYTNYHDPAGPTESAITASYAAGVVSSGNTSAAINPLRNDNRAATATTVTDSYWDSTLMGAFLDSSNDPPAAIEQGVGKTTSELQSPTGYTNDFADWNVDADNADGDNTATTGADDPWDFGTASQYPILKLDGAAYGQALQRPTDHAGDNTLIDVDSLAKLNAIRWDLNGDGLAGGANTDAYLAAFPGIAGCDPACTGYELTGSLDFAGSQWASGAGWTPLGVDSAGAATPYTATFDGNGHTISNLRINLTTSTADGGSYVGLFGDSSGTIRDVGIVSPSISNTRTGGGAFSRTAALVGRINTGGEISGVWVDGGTVTVSDSTTTNPLTGCLVGYSDGAISSSWTSCAISATSAGSGAGIANYAGGLVGFGANGGSISGSHATGTVTLSGNTHINAGGLAGRARANITSSYATGAVVSNSTTNAGQVGGLVGFSSGDIKASWASGSVSAAGALRVGGLVGYADLGGSNVIQAAYATGAVGRSNTSGAGDIGALLGRLRVTGSNTALVQAVYAVGAVSNASGDDNPGGLIGLIDGDNTDAISNAYWNHQSVAAGGTGQSNTYTCAPGSCPNYSGQDGADLKRPEQYGGIYPSANWNLDLDTGGADDPWDFGPASQYPILTFGHDLRSIQRQRGQAAGTTDYDVNDNNLIDISTLAQLDAVRYDLAGVGDSAVTGGGAAKYLAAFPGLVYGMGCPAGCAGYELTAHLDFDTNHDGEVTSADDYESWVPIGQGPNATAYNARFVGNGYTIANLTISTAVSSPAGLFGQTGDGAVISGVGLPQVNIVATSTARSGALAGSLRGAAYASWSTGTVSSAGYAGGLVGAIESNNTPKTGILSASWSSATVTSTGALSAGGLVGRSWDIINYSYATGVVTNTGSGAAGGLVGTIDGAATVRASYWDTGTSGISTASTITGVTGYASSALKTPTAYGSSSATPPDIYADWNLDLDNADNDGNLATGGDDPWDFGTNSQYPILKHGGHSGRSDAWQGRGGYAITSGGAAATEPLTVTEAEAAGTSYGIALAVAPDAAVTVTITGDADDDVTFDTGDGTFSDSETLTFTTANWATPQTLTLKAAADSNIIPDTSEPGLTLTAANAAANAPSGYAGVSRDVDVTATDSTTVSIVLTPTELSMTEEGANATYTVVLSDLPEADVTVTVTSSDVGAAEIDGPDAATAFTVSEVLTFDADTTGQAGSWDTAQTISVQAPHDNDNSDETVTLTHTAAGANSGYDGLTADLTVRITDDDVPNIELSTTSLTIAEDMTSTYDVVLTVIPTADVTVTVTATGAMIDNGSGTFAASKTLSFDAATTGQAGSWNTAQTITVDPTPDNDLGQGSASISHRVTATTDGRYSNKTATANVTITNTETGEINLTAAQDPLEVDEGSTATYTVALGKRPAEDATVAITVDPASGVTVNPTSLTFTRAGWSASGTQTVTVTAADNDGNLITDAFDLTHTGGDLVSGVSSGYGGGTPITAELDVDVLDTTTATLTLSTTTISIPEEGSDVTYTVRLSDEPSANVTVTIASDNAAITLDTDGDGTFTASETLTFTASNYATTQDVEVRAPHDTNPTHERVTLTHTGSDPGTASGYADVTASIIVNVRDNDTPGIRLSSEMLNVDEAGTATNLYTVRLNTLPADSADVTVTFTATGVTIDADGDGNFNASETLTFTAGSGPLNWETAQNISVRGPVNNNDLANTTGSIAHRAASADNDYQGQTETAAVAIANTETGEINLTSATDPLEVKEGSSAAYTVALGKRPTANATVTLVRNLSGVTINPSSLTFTRSNWNRAQTVTVGVDADDSNYADVVGTLMVTHIGGDAGADASGYAGIPNGVLDVTLLDTTSPPISLSPNQSEREITEGAPAVSYQVQLATQPADTVTVAVSSNDPAVTVSVSSLTFTTGNWSSGQQVDITAVADADNFNNAAAVSFTPTMRDVVSPERTLAVLVNEPAPGPDDPAPRTRITAPPAGAQTAQYDVDSQTVRVTSGAGVPAGATIATVESLTADLTLTLTAPPENVPARGGGFRLNAGSIVDITLSRDLADAEAGLEVCLPKGRDDIMMLRYSDSGGWVEVPGSRVSGDRICATITDFSVFGVGRRAGAELLETAIEFGEGRYAEITVQVQDTTTESVRVTWVVGEAISGASASANDFANADHTAPLTSFPRGSITVPPGADATAVIRIPIYDDALAEGPERFTVRITQASGGIADHNDLPIEAVIALSDPTLSLRAPDGTGTGGADDTANAPLTASSTLVITEGQTHAYTIALSARPDGDVTVVIHSNHDGVTTNPPSVDFTRANWQQPQRVTVTTAQDGDDKHDQATLTHILTDADGALIEIIDRLKLFVVDTDPPDDDDIC